jgi:carboxypeptidase PM20D1
MPFTNKMAFSNLWLFRPIVFKQLGASNAGNAMMRTTQSHTLFNSGVKDNVIPSNAVSVMNFRTLPGVTSKEVMDRVSNIINDQRVLIRIAGVAVEATPVTSAEHASFQLVAQSIREVFQDAIVTPYLCLGATDSRNFVKISEATLRFAPFTDTEGYHGVNERVSIEQYKKAIRFYFNLIGKL